MRKYLKIIILFILIISCSGCVKYEENMKINKNKSMSIELIVATNNKDKINSMFDDNEINNLGDFYKISKYSDDNYSGYKLLWKTNNIDKVSSTSSDVVYSLTSMRESVPTNIFRASKGLFTNTYYADFVFDPSDFNTEYDSNIKNDLVFSVELDKKSISNNANKIKNNGKKLVWNLSDKDITEINFSFTMVNYSKIVFAIIFGIVILILLFISSKKFLEKRV